MITMAISGRHGHVPIAGVIPLEFRLLLLVVCVMIGVVLMDGFVVRLCGVLLLPMILQVLFCRGRVRLWAVGALSARSILLLLVSLIRLMLSIDAEGLQNCSGLESDRTCRRSPLPPPEHASLDAYVTLCRRRWNRAKRSGADQEALLVQAW